VEVNEVFLTEIAPAAAKEVAFLSESAAADESKACSELVEGDLRLSLFFGGRRGLQALESGPQHKQGSSSGLFMGSMQRRLDSRAADFAMAPNSNSLSGPLQYPL
jgi:hypothetical protein